MKLHKSTNKIIIETPSSIDFYEKRFHLSGNFKPSKKDFGDKLEETGAKYSGIKRDENHKSHLTLGDTDYLILADEGITDTGVKKDYGNKAKSIQAHNDKAGQAKHIPIIMESHCKKLIDEFLARKKTNHKLAYFYSSR